ncbi:MAG: heavy-metal-associated domain-containing protein [Acetivibrionales bacterium]
MEGCQGGKPANAPSSVKFKLECISCEACSPQQIKEKLENTQGVIEVDIDENAKEVFVDFEMDKVKQEEIRAKLEKMGCKII